MRMMRKNLRALSFVITICLVFSMFTLLSWSEVISESEEDEILRVAKEGMLVYDIVGGNGSIFKAHIELCSMETYTKEWGYDEKMLSALISDYKNIFIYTESPPFGQLSSLYHETGEAIKSLEDLYDLIDQYFFNYTWVFTDEESCPRDEYGEYIINPTLVNVDGKTYLLHSGMREFDHSLAVPFYFDEFKIKEVSGTFATVETKYAVCERDWDDNGTEFIDVCETYVLDVNMVKTRAGWRICGGEYFDEISIYTTVEDNWFKDAPPVTGDTSILHLAIAAAALVSMTAVVFKKKRRIAE